MRFDREPIRWHYLRLWPLVLISPFSINSRYAGRLTHLANANEGCSLLLYGSFLRKEVVFKATFLSPLYKPPGRLHRWRSAAAALHQNKLSESRHMTSFAIWRYLFSMISTPAAANSFLARCTVLRQTLQDRATTSLRGQIQRRPCRRAW